MPDERAGSDRDGVALDGRGPRRRLLIVDDDPLSLEFASQILRPLYEVDVALDAQEARGKLIGGRLELLLCDIYMPGESGLELAEWVL
jgi:CheY-like chemotaxis protein